MRRRPSGDSGASTVELALVFPLFVGVVAVGAFFAWWAYTQAQLDRAATRAARFAAVPTTTGAYDFCHDRVLARVDADVQSAVVTPAEVVVADRTGTLAPGSACSVPRGHVRVTVSHAYRNPFTSVVSLLTPVAGTFTVTGQGEARVEA